MNHPKNVGGRDVQNRLGRRQTRPSRGSTTSSAHHLQRRYTRVGTGGRKYALKVSYRIGLRRIPETQVDTISWSVLCGQFDAPAYDSKVQPIYGDAQGAPVKYWQRATENIKTLTREYRCPLHLVCDFAHGHDMEAFASVRMNDVHDSFMDANAMTVWKRTHPELMVDTRGTLPEFELYMTAQDFSHEAVRRRKLEIIEEICHRYDVDGFELDYIRHPVLFSRRMRGEPCTTEEIAIITSMMREIRSLTDAAAERRGRPLLTAVRVPDTFHHMS